MKGMDYLIVIDYYSRYVEVAAMTKTTKSSEIIRALNSIFARHGILEQVRSDSGPQYDSAEFSHFAKQWGFKHVTSSPRFPQSNGEVEHGVRTVKNLLQKAEDPAKGLLAYRSTPLVPAEDKIAAPVQADQPKLKMNSQAAPATPLLANRAERLLKPSS